MVMTPVRVVVVGSLNMDLVVRTPRFPRPGETIAGHGFHTVAGGKGANQAAAAAKLGASVAMVGCVGADDFGGRHLAGLGRLGVNVDALRRDDTAPTGVAVITIDETGQNTIVLDLGANMRLSAEDVRAAEATIASASILLVQLEIPLEAVEQALRLARRHQVTAVLNPAPALSLPRSVLSLVDVLIPNESETALLTGIEVNDFERGRAAAEKLLDAGVGTVVMTLGERGALAVSSQTVVHSPGFQVNVVDTTAAGDAFVAGFAVALAEGCDLSTAARFANAAGAVAVTRLGAQPSLPTRQEAEALIHSGG